MNEETKQAAEELRASLQGFADALAAYAKLCAETEASVALENAVKEGYAPKDDDELLTLDEAATEISVSRRTVERWIEGGRLDAVGRHKFRRVRRGDLQGAMNAN